MPRLFGEKRRDVMCKKVRPWLASAALLAGMGLTVGFAGATGQERVYVLPPESALDEPVIRRSETGGRFDTPEQREIEREADQFEADRRREQKEELRRQQEFDDFLNERQMIPGEGPRP